MIDAIRAMIAKLQEFISGGSEDLKNSHAAAAALAKDYDAVLKKLTGYLADFAEMERTGNTAENAEGVQYSLSDRDASLYGVSPESFSVALNLHIQQKIGAGVYRAEDAKSIISAATAFFSEFSKKEIPLSTGGVVYFMPDVRSAERLHFDNSARWAEYCIHQVTSQGKKLKSGEAMRVFDRMKVSALSQIEGVVRAENVKPSRGGITFWGNLSENKRLEIYTRPDRDGNLFADLSEVSFGIRRNKKENPPHTPLTGVADSGVSRAAGYSLSADSSLTLSEILATLASKKGSSSGSSIQHSLGRGYDGFSMSNNARAAYAEGEKPVSKWTKMAILDEVKKISPEKAAMLKGVSLPVLRANVLEWSAWHHTSSHYNETDFYRVNEGFVKRLDQKEADRLAGLKVQDSPDTKFYRGDFDYVEWGGTKAHPKAGHIHLANVNIEERGSFYIVTDDAGKQIVRKKIGSNGTEATNYDEVCARDAERRARSEEEFDASTEAARNFLKMERGGKLIGIPYDSSSSGKIYEKGRKPSPADYDAGLENFFKKGEKRASRISFGRSGYQVETWDGTDWIPEKNPAPDGGIKYSLSLGDGGKESSGAPLVTEEVRELYEMANLAWNNPEYKKTILFPMSDRLAKAGGDLLGHPVSVFGITADAIRHIKTKHGDDATEKPRGQEAMTPEDIAVIPYLVNNFDSIDIDDEYSKKFNKALTIRKRINGVAVIATIEQGKDKTYLVTSWKNVPAAPMLRDKTRPPGLNARNVTDNLENVQRDIKNIKQELLARRQSGKKTVYSLSPVSDDALTEGPGEIIRLMTDDTSANAIEAIGRWGYQMLHEMADESGDEVLKAQGARLDKWISEEDTDEEREEKFGGALRAG